MVTSKFGPNCTGKIIEISGGQNVRASHAFIPNPLPPQWNWPVALWPLLLKAREELARLDGVGRHLPNPNLLLTPLQNREAQRSSSLEGTIATPQQLALFEIDAEDSALEKDAAEAAREVNNYARALRLGAESSEKLPLSLRTIRMLHEVLLEGVHGSNATPGAFRRGQVQIGGNARFVPPPANYLPDCLDQLEKYLHAEKMFDPLVEAFLVHYQFETIHPFMDGNGRVGRLLLSLTIKEWCGLAEQWLYMSAYFDRFKDEYIDRLFQISTNGDWTAWIEFCLHGVVEQALDTQQRCTNLLALREEYHRRLAEISCSNRINRIVEDLFINPVVTAVSLRERTSVTYPTARADIDCLVQLGILQEIQLRQRRQKGYYCEDIFKITYGDNEQ